jgi:hypothetical protein
LILGVILLVVSIHFAQSKLIAAIAPVPSDEIFEDGAKHVFCIDPDKNSTLSIFIGEEEVIWRLHKKKGSSYGAFTNIVFTDIVSDVDHYIELLHFFPLTYVIEGDGTPICTIERKSILKNKFTIKTESGITWLFRMPLFTNNFWAESSNGKRIWIIENTKMNWLVLSENRDQNVDVILGLAFINRYRWLRG